MTSDIVVSMSTMGGATKQPWHAAVAHDRGASFESRCGLTLWPAHGVDGLRVTSEERLPDDTLKCERCFTSPRPARLFTLERDVDESGVSGVGVVAEGVEFSDGTCAMRWLTKVTSVAVYASMDDLLSIHGHGGKTRVVNV